MTATTNLQKWIAVYVEQIRQLERAFFQILLDTVLDTALGFNLDVVGRIVGEQRFGRNDTDYRTAIRGRILLNLSDGTAEDIIAVIRSQIGDKKVITTEDSFPAHFEALIPDTIDVLRAFVTSDSAELFALSGGDTLDVVVDGGPSQTVTFDAADFADITKATAAEVAQAISQNLTGGNAVQDIGFILLRTDTFGELGSIEITGGTANAVLNFPAGEVTGEEVNQALMVRVSNTMQSARGTGIRGILFWNTCAESFGFAGTVGALGFTQGCFASALDV